MTPKIRFKPSESRARTPPSSTPLSSASSRKMSKMAMGGGRPFSSDSEIRFADRVAGQQLGGGAGGADAAGLEHVRAIDDAQHLLHVLLDDQHGEAGGPEARHQVEDLLHDDGS